MRITPVKPVSSWRRIWMRLHPWGIAIRMKEVHGNPDVWFTESTSPKDGSPWALTDGYVNSCEVPEAEHLIYAVKSEGEYRIEAMQDFFAGMQTAMRTRQVYSLYVLSRATIEASAFAVWVYDPAIEPEERVLRGLLLRAEHLKHETRTLNKDLQAGLAFDKAAQDYLEELTKLETKIGRAIQQTSADLQSRTSATPCRAVPSKTRRIREMLHEDMKMPYGFDAYHRLSGVAHSQALAIADIWNLSQKRPFIDYFDFLAYLHLAVCCIDFSLERRSACWGETYKAPRLRTLIARLELMLSVEVEPEVRFL